jgi:glycerophosphoryl diester phosphodiesterase
MALKRKGPKIIAHRGASGYAPEITLEAYRQVIPTGCDGVELDVQMLCDGTLIAFHDTDVGRTTDGTGPLSGYTLEAIKKLDAGAWFNRAFPEKARPEYVGLRVPALEEILKLLKESPLEFFIEIKNPELYPPDFEARVIECVDKNQLEDRTLFMSFSGVSIGKIKTLRASSRTALLVCRMTPDPVSAARAAGADVLGILHDLATPALIESARKYDIGFSVWTVDEPEDMRRMLALGVDCVTSNYPDRLVQMRKNMGNRIEM